jgi:hypothetical protein
MSTSIRDVVNLAFLARNETLVISGSIHSDMNELARALGKKAEEGDANVLAIKAGALFEFLARERAGKKAMKDEDIHPAQVSLLLVENFGMKKLSLSQTKDFCDLMMERLGRLSTIITSPYLLVQWVSHIPESEEGGLLYNSLLKDARQVVIGGRPKKNEKKPAPIIQPMQACG